MILDSLQELFECYVVTFEITNLQTYIIIGNRPVNNIVIMLELLILIAIIEYELYVNAFG